MNTIMKRELMTNSPNTSSSSKWHLVSGTYGTEIRRINDDLYQLRTKGDEDGNNREYVMLDFNMFLQIISDYNEDEVDG